ncbi:hypothetical protein G5I_07574 [Acromyrmex echinatior]|uniref:Uncharacterized protein n=1 Tax=Acromyrmex echinatior TaxID=103372 RepID=F4WP64_ACREC|nr:hypothetical protein G5I_07574 [Acromyrmex echinatior]
MKATAQHSGSQTNATESPRRLMGARPSADDRDFRHIALSNKLHFQQFLYGGLDNGIFPNCSVEPDETTKCFMLKTDEKVGDTHKRLRAVTGYRLVG